VQKDYSSDRGGDLLTGDKNSKTVLVRLTSLRSMPRTRKNREYLSSV